MFASGQVAGTPEDLWPGLHRSVTPNAMPSTPRPRRPYQHKNLPRQPSRRGRGRGGAGAGSGGLLLGATSPGLSSVGSSIGGLSHSHLVGPSGSWSARDWRPIGEVGDVSRIRPSLVGPEQQQQAKGHSDKGTQVPDRGPSAGYVSNVLIAGGGGGANANPPGYCQKRVYKQLPNETEEQRLARLAANRERARLRRANESLEERQRRLADNRERARTRRAQESEEARFVRLADNRERARSRRALETADQRLARLAFDRTRARERRVHESAEERDLRLADGRARGRMRWMNETEEQRRQRLNAFREKARMRRTDDPSVRGADGQQQQSQLSIQQGGGTVGRLNRAPRGRRRNQRTATTNTGTSTARHPTDHGLQQDFVAGLPQQQQAQQQQQPPMGSGDQEIRLVEQLLAPSDAPTVSAAAVSSTGNISSVAYPPNGHTGPFYSSRSDHVNAAPCSACYPLEPFIKFNQGKQLLCEGHSRLSQGLQLRHQEFI